MIIIGAGIVGICTAIECQRRGLNVTLVDASPPASETSAGNAGIICNSGIHPQAEPGMLRKSPVLLSGLDPRLLIRLRALPGIAPWLGHFARHCTTRQYQEATGHLITLTRDALARHQKLMTESRSDTLLQPTGWLKLFRNAATWQTACKDIPALERAGVEATALDTAALRALEPDLGDLHSHGLWLRNTHSVSDPAALCDSYFNLFASRGGKFLKQRVTSIQCVETTWQVATADDSLEANHVVVATGAWANDLLRPLGLRLPLVQERGYHMMFDYSADVHLGRSIVDPERGYVLTPMQSGIRVTSAANIVGKESSPDPRQLERLLPEIRDTFAIGPAQLDRPWMGRRPSTPDSMPLIGAIPGRPGLYAATGHGHLGLTLGPITGALIADAVSGEPSPIAAPFSPDRWLKKPLQRS